MMLLIQVQITSPLSVAFKTVKLIESNGYGTRQDIEAAKKDFKIYVKIQDRSPSLNVFRSHTMHK